MFERLARRLGYIPAGEAKTQIDAANLATARERVYRRRAEIALERPRPRPDSPEAWRQELDAITAKIPVMIGDAS